MSYDLDNSGLDYVSKSSISEERWNEIFVHSFLKQYRIGVSGLIGPGKTTLCNAAANEYGLILHEEPNEKNPWLKFFYKNKKKYAFHTQMWFIAKRYHSYKISLGGPTGGIIHDRTLFEDKVFATMLHKSGYISDEEFETYKLSFDGFCIDLKIPDFIIYLDATPEICLERIKARDRESESSIDLEYLQSLEESYRDYIDDMSKKTIVFVVDWNTFKPTKKVFEVIYDFYSQMEVPKVGRFRLSV